MSVLKINECVSSYSLFPRTFNALTFRILFATAASFLLSNTLPHLSGVHLTSFLVGTLNYEKILLLISRRIPLFEGINNDTDNGSGLAVIQGLEEKKDRRRMTEIGINSIQALATANLLTIFLRTTFPLKTIVDMQDKAIFYLYLDNKVEKLRHLGINGIIELVSIVKLQERKTIYSTQSETKLSPAFENFDYEKMLDDIAQALEQPKSLLKYFIYNMYYDPTVMFLGEVWGRFMSKDNFPTKQEQSTSQSLSDS